MAQKNMIYMLLSTFFAVATADKVMFCYYASWASYRTGIGAFSVSDIDSSLCTHYVYAFAGVDSINGVITSLDAYNDLPDNYGKDQYDKFSAMTQDNPDITTLLAVGGWNLGSAVFSIVSATDDTRETFADSVVDFLKQYGFQGIDIDWEYPTQRDGSPDDKDNFVLLLKTLSEKLQAEGLLLTIAVAGDVQIIAEAYDIEGISKYVDYISVMTFDYHTASTQRVTGINSPLSPSDSETGTAKNMNIEASIAAWVSGGAPKEKLLVGIPLYGRTFTLSSATRHDIGDSITGPGTAGKYTQEAGSLGYYEICTAISDNPDSWTKVYDNKTASLYAYNGRQWISYDDVVTLKIKSNFVVDQGLGGAMIWSIETDDFREECDGGANPLQNRVKSTLGIK